MTTTSEITNSQDGDNLISQIKNGQELIVFKYSTTCSVSYTAQNIFNVWLKSLKDHTDLIIVKVDVIKRRELSNKIEQQTGVRHESPQIIWLYSGTVKWHASHFEISAKALSAQLNSYNG